MISSFLLGGSHLFSKIKSKNPNYFSFYSYLIILDAYLNKKKIKRIKNQREPHVLGDGILLYIESYIQKIKLNLTALYM